VLLVLANAVILRSESRGTYDHILLSQIRDRPTWRARPPYLYPPGIGLPVYTSRHWVPFSSPPTTRRATVEVVDPASTREFFNLFLEVHLYVGLTDVKDITVVPVVLSLFIFLFFPIIWQRVEGAMSISGSVTGRSGVIMTTAK
jgi:hypothetical protein